MTNSASYYQKQIHKKIQRLTTWEPHDEIAVGDIGVMHKGAFVREATLAELGLPCEVEDSGEPEGYRSFTSSTGVAVRTQAGGELPQGFARLVASFQSAGAFIFEVAGVQQRRLAGQQQVIAGLRELRKNKRRWNRRWVLINQVWQVERGTVIIATGDATEVGVTVRADAGPGLESLAKSDVVADLEVRGADVYRALGKTNFTPLYTAWTFNLWGNVKHLGNDDAGPDDEGPPPALGIDDVLASWEEPDAAT